MEEVKCLLPGFSDRPADIYISLMSSEPYAQAERPTKIDITVGVSFTTPNESSKSDVCRASRGAAGDAVIASRDKIFD